MRISANPGANRAAFLDRDGVINIDHGYVSRQDNFEWVPGVLEAAKSLHDVGFLLVVVTNQSGIGRGYYSEGDFESLTAWMKDCFADAGAPLSGVYYCPHHPTNALGELRRECQCRKPQPGMLLQAAKDLNIDLSRSVIFGDKPSDILAGIRAGCAERILLGTDGKSEPSPVLEATHVFRTLADAVASPWFESLKATKISDEAKHMPAPGFESKICPMSELSGRVAALPKPIVFTNGVFDILHRGHVTYLAQARALGGSLIVAVNSDRSVKMLGKGADRPINSEADRAAVIASLESVSLVTVFDDKVPLKAVALARPDIYVKGGDYLIEDLPEAALCAAWGGQTVTIPFEHQRSTTAILKKIRAC